MGVGNFEKHSKNTICDYEVFKKTHTVAYPCSVQVLHYIWKDHQLVESQYLKHTK